MRRHYSERMTEQRRNARSARRLRRRVLKALNRGQGSFRYNSWISDGYPFPQSVIDACQASLPQGVTVRQEVMVRGSYEQDLVIFVELP